MGEKKHSLVLTWVLPVSLILLLLVFILHGALFFFRQNRDKGEGVIPDFYLAVYAYGNVEQEGPFYIRSNQLTVGEISSLAGAHFSDSYYQIHGIEKTHKITYSDCKIVNGRHTILLYYPPENMFPVYSLNSVTQEQLIFFGLSQDAVERVLNYRMETGAIVFKGDLLSQNVLTKEEYAFISANLETLPNPIRFLINE